MKCFLARIRSYNYAVQSYTQFFVISDKTVLKWNIRRGAPNVNFRKLGTLRYNDEDGNENFKKQLL